MRLLSFNGHLIHRLKARACLCSLGHGGCAVLPELRVGLILRVTLLVTPGMTEEPSSPAPRFLASTLRVHKSTSRVARKYDEYLGWLQLEKTGGQGF